MSERIFKDKAGTCWPHEYDWRAQFAALEPGDGFIPMDAGKVYGMARTLDNALRIIKDRADAIDDALQSRALGEAVAWMHNTNGDAFVISDAVKDLWLNSCPQHVEHYTIPLYKSPPVTAVTDEMVECASEAYDDVYTAEITANTSADNKHQAIRAALEAALGSP